MKRILLIGPFTPPITGESLVNDFILKTLSKEAKFNIKQINNAYPIFREDLGKFSFRKTWFYLRQYIKLYKIYSVQIVYLTIGQTFLGVLKYAPYIIFSKWLNKEIIIHVHGNSLKKQYDSLKGLKKYLVKMIISKGNKGIVLSELLIPNLSEFIPRKNIFILSNFVEDCLIEPKDKLFNVKNTNCLKVIYLSNLMTEKGILYLLESLKVLSEKGVKYKAKLAGNIDASIREMVLEKIDANNSVDYLGIIEGDEKKKLLLWGNVFVFPSYLMEGQPLSILEAMATGNIIITTRHDGISTIVSRKNGFYINKQDSKDIVNKLQFVEKNLYSLKSIMKFNYDYVKDSYTENIFIDSLEKILLS
jgi:glycosyltransferase involved in cell wall biosynthesis